MCRRRHMSPRTEESYRHWIRRFILFHEKRHPREMTSVVALPHRRLSVAELAHVMGSFVLGPG